MKSLAIWTIGRIGPEAFHKVKKPLITALTDSYWKVRTTACMAVSSMGPQIADAALPVLTKVSSLNVDLERRVGQLISSG